MNTNKTLIVDGDNLLTIGFHGLKNYFYKGRHIGAIYHFINTLRLTFETYHLDKIVVFWDGENSALLRRKSYSPYKLNRNIRIKSEEEVNSYNYQRNRVKQYLEELYVRQAEFEDCETDDCVAYYTQNAKKEDIIIYSSDRDLAQLVSKNISLYNPSHRKLYKPHDIIEYEHEEILIENVRVVKIICGDKSDNIYGIRSLGIKKLLNLCPELKIRPVTIDEVRSKGNLLFEENSSNTTIKNLLTGVTKEGVYGEEFFEINTKIIDLSNPFVSDEAKEEIKSLITENMDTTGRSYKNTMKMMMEDGLFNVLPKRDDAWIKFLTPFLILTRKEKNKHITRIRK